MMGAREIGSKIREYRKLAGLTQEDLAIQAKIATATLQRIELNKFSPTLSTLEQIAEALKCEVYDFLAPEPALEGLLTLETLSDVVALLRRLEKLSPPRRKIALAVLFRDKRYLADNPTLVRSLESLDLLSRK